MRLEIIWFLGVNNQTAFPLPPSPFPTKIIAAIKKIIAAKKNIIAAKNFRYQPFRFILRFNGVFDSNLRFDEPGRADIAPCARKREYDGIAFTFLIPGHKGPEGRQRKALRQAYRQARGGEASGEFLRPALRGKMQAFGDAGFLHAADCDGFAMRKCVICGFFDGVCESCL